MPEMSPDKKFEARLSSQLQTQRGLGSVPIAYKRERAAWCVTWRRTIAFVIDYVLLAFFGWLIIKIGGQYLIPLGEDGWWIGVCVLAGYFTFFDSRLGHGMTIGKRIVGIEVRRLDGFLLSPIDSFLRFSPFGLVCVIWFVTRFGDPSSVIMLQLMFAAILAVLAIAVFGLFHPQHRAIQDLIADTVVVRANRIYSLSQVSIKKPVIIFAVIGALICSGEVALGWYLAKHPDGRSIVTMWEVLNRRSDVRNSFIYIGKTLDEESKPVRSVIVDSFLPNPTIAMDERLSAAVASEVAGVLAASHAVPRDVRQILVLLWSGVDIGIARSMKAGIHKFPVNMGMSPKLRYRSTSGSSREQKQDSGQEPKKDMKK